MASVPPYAMPDRSIPPYEQIISELAGNGSCFIGSSCFYVTKQDQVYSLHRIVCGSTKIFFHESLSHEDQGITSEEIAGAARKDAEFSSLPGYYPITAGIRDKLRTRYAR
jgi:hypothetical protein